MYDTITQDDCTQNIVCEQSSGTYNPIPNRLLKFNTFITKEIFLMRFCYSADFLSNIPQLMSPFSDTLIGTNLIINRWITGYQQKFKNETNRNS